MIIVRTPFRISFCGGGSDLPEFYERSTGCVVSTSIDKYMYISVHPFFHKDDIHIKYSRTETVKRITDINHPIIRTALSRLKFSTGWEISSNADIPSGTGLGSSSSFTVGLLHALYSQQGHFVTKEQLASEACEIEIIDLLQPIGKQDQYAAAFGGLNEITFNTDGTVVVEPIVLNKESKVALEESLIAFYTGDVRAAESVLTEQKKNTAQDDHKFDQIRQMVEIARESNKLLVQNDFFSFGKLLHEGWLLKQNLATGITNDKISQIYETGIRHGAVGGKLLGAGGGGFMLFYCPKERQQKLRDVFKHLKEFKFNMETSGTRVLHASDYYDFP